MNAPPGNERAPAAATAEGAGWRHRESSRGHDSTAAATAEAGLSAAGTFALAYARRGWHVFPCRPDKAPFTAHGFQDASTDDAQIRAWWKRWPNAQVGVAAGASDLVVVDCDTKNGVNGIEAFEQICGLEDHGAALIARTPSGGLHYVFAARGVRYKNDSAVLAAGVDIRGWGGYFCAPSGVPGREWIEGDPFEDEPEPLPDWLAEKIPLTASTSARASGESRTRASAAKRPPVSDERFREVSSALFAIPASLQRGAWLSCVYAVHAALDSDPRGEALVETWSASTYDHSKDKHYKPGEAMRVYRKAVDPARARADRDLVDAGTLFAIARDHGWQDMTRTDPGATCGAEQEDAEPLSRPRVPEFPRSLLDADNAVARAARWIIESSSRPRPEWAVGAALPFFAALTGRRVEMRANGFRTRPRLIVINTGPTTGGKSQAAAKMVGAFEDAGLEEFVGPGKFKSDASIRTEIAERPSVVCPIDEFGKYFGAVNSSRSASYQMNIGATLLEVFTAGRRLQGAKAADKRYNSPTVHYPCLSIAANSTTAGFFGGLADGSLEDGTLNRFIVIPSPDATPARQDASDKHEKAVIDELDAIHKWLDSRASSFNQINGDGPVEIGVHDGVAKMLQAIEDEQYERAEADEETGAVWGRLAELTSYIALTLAASGRRDEVDESDIRWGHELATWSVSYLAAEVGLWTGQSPFGRLVNEIERGARRLVDGRRLPSAKRREIKANGFSSRDLRRRVSASTPREFNDAFSFLCEVGRLRATGKKNRSGKDLFLPAR